MESIRKEIEGRALYRDKVSTSVDIPLSAGDASACWATPPKRRSGCSTTTSAPSTSCSGLMREEKSVAAGHPGREGDAPHRGARGHRPAPEREGERRQDQGDAAPLGVLPRPHGGRRPRQPRPAGGPRRRAGAHRPGAVPPHAQQPRADRRAGGGQDGARGGPGQQDRAGRRPRLPGRQAHPGPRHLADRGRHQVPRPVRGAPEDDHAGAHREPQHHHLHRRAAHPGGRGLRRGHPRRRQHPEARPLPRRDPVHRRHHPRRVPQVHREGPLAGAPLPGGEGGLAHRGGDDPDPARDQGPLREVPPRDLPRRGPRGRGLPVEPLHHRPLPARQGHRPPGRGGQPREAARRRGAVEEVPEFSRKIRVVVDRSDAWSAGGPSSATRRWPSARTCTSSASTGTSAGRGAHEVTKGDIDDVVSQVDGHPHHRHQGRGVGQAPAHGGGAAPADRLPGERDQRGGARHPPHAGRPQEPEPAGGLVHVPGPDRGGQDRGGAQPGRVPVRQRARASSASTCPSTWRSTRSAS